MSTSVGSLFSGGDTYFYIIYYISFCNIGLPVCGESPTDTRAVWHEVMEARNCEKSLHGQELIFLN